MDCYTGYPCKVSMLTPRHTDVVYTYSAHMQVLGLIYKLRHLQAQGVYYISHLCSYDAVLAGLIKEE